MKLVFLILFLFGFDLNSISAQAAANHTSGQLTVCDKVTSYSVPINLKRPHKLFLGGTENSIKKFAITIWSEDLHKIEIEPVSLVGKNVCASGEIRAYQSKRTGHIHVQITVRDQEQLLIDWRAK